MGGGRALASVGSGGVGFIKKSMAK